MCQLLDQNSSSWNMSRLVANFVSENVKHIFSIHVSIHAREDKLVLHWEAHGEYTVTYGYRIARGSKHHQKVHSHGDTSLNAQQGLLSFWKNFRRNDLPRKIKIFLWNLCL